MSSAPFAVLLRGVNVGAHNRISMHELRSALEAAGCDEVRTVAQSGNAVLRYSGTPEDVEAMVRRVLVTNFSLDVDLIVRDADAIRAIVADNPLCDVATDGSRQFVVFCSEAPDQARLPEVEAPEQLICRPLELHAWCPAGAIDSKLLTALGRRPPAPITTFRNWNTVCKLCELLDVAPQSTIRS